jgi:4-amino-4-deoxy-L-arabinose transferase-like glycosyltransferase
MAILSVVVLIGHQALPPMDRDESRFAQASKQMQQTGDYVTVRFQDELRAKKPAGIYWLQSSFARILGPDAIASYRFVNLLALLACSYMTRDQPWRQQHYFQAGFWCLARCILPKPTRF